MGKNEKYHSIIKTQNIAFILSVCIAGGALISLSFYLESDNSFISTLLLTFGSSLLGTGFGILINSFTNQSVLLGMRELIEHAIQGPLSTPDDTLDGFRSKMHNYLLTQSNGKWVWRYRQFDFSKIQPPGKLMATVTVSDPKNSKISHEYIYEAYFVGSRMILVGIIKNSTEPSVIQIFPFATERYNNNFAGEAFLRTWDGIDVVSTPILMATNKIELSGSYSEGTMSDKMGKELSQIWDKSSNRNGIKYAEFIKGK